MHLRDYRNPGFSEVKFMDRVIPASVDDEKLYSHVKRVGEDLVGESNVHLHPLILGFDDFSFYSQRMPSAMFVGIRNESLGSIHNLHSPNFTIDEGGLPIGAAFHAAVPLAYLERDLSTL